MLKGEVLNRNIFNVGALKYFALVLAASACVIYAIYLGQAIHVERALFADGSNFFVDLLSQKNIWPVADDPKHIRLLANALNQLPLVVALKFGVEDLRTLKLLFGAGLFTGSVVVYLFCYSLSRRASDYRVFLFSVVSLITCAIPSDVFILNQSFISLALAWVLIHYLLLKMKIRWFDWLVIALVSIVLFRAHENLVLWGGTLFIGAAAVIRLGYNDGVLSKNRQAYVLGIVGLAQAFFVIFWQATHPVGQQTDDFLKLIKLILPQELWVGNTRISVLTTSLLAVALFYGRACRGANKSNRLILVSVFLIFSLVSSLVLYCGASAIHDFGVTNPGREFSYRFLMTFGSTGWMLVSIAFVLAKIEVDVRGSYLAIIALSIGLFSASMWQISNNLQWSDFERAAAFELRVSPGPFIPPESVRDRLRSENREYAYKYRWSWTWPVFGMSLQNDGRVEKMFRPEGFDQYFNPPKSIPFVPMSGGDYGSAGRGVYKFDGFHPVGNNYQ